MKKLNTLIRYKKQQVDELRRKQAVLETQKEAQLKRSAALSEELKSEQKLASVQPEMRGFFGDFAGRIKRRQVEITKEVQKLDRQMDDLREQIRRAFGELKKYEIVRDNRMNEERQEENRKENMALDDVAIEQHRRKEQD